MKVFLIAFPSIHTEKWINQFKHMKDIKFIYFPSIYSKKNISLINFEHKSFFFQKNFNFKNYYISFSKINFINRFFQYFLFKILPKKILIYSIKNIILKYKPDYIHSLEFQNSSKQILLVKKIFFKNRSFPKWIATNWGSDLYFFDNIKKHYYINNKILNNCNFYSAECKRDYFLGERISKEKFLPIIPNSGGFDLEFISSIRSNKPTSKRNIVFVKGFDSIVGRASNFLNSILLLDKEFLSKYDFVFYSYTKDFKKKANIISRKYKLNFSYLETITNKLFLKKLSEARVYVGLSASDGISTSLLESMALGVFPIQSSTSCANEWIDSNNGFIVDYLDFDQISKRLMKALTDDLMVDRANDINWKITKEKLDSNKISIIARTFYK